MTSRSYHASILVVVLVPLFLTACLQINNWVVLSILNVEQAVETLESKYKSGKHF